jgi:DHA3 family macrolide efflux protein-like MFS transporter
MLIGGIALGLILGLLLGGRLERLADIRLRYLSLLFVAVVLRLGTEILISYRVGFADTLRLPLFVAAYGLLLFTLWHNRGYPGLALAFVGIAANGIVIAWNLGYMPVWLPALQASGLPTRLDSPLHVLLDPGTAAGFFSHLGPLADVIPNPIWPLQNVASVGDLFLSSGLAVFLFATLVRAPEEIEQALIDARIARVAGTRVPRPGIDVDADGYPVWPETGLSSALAATAALERPRLLGGGGIGLAGPTSSTLVPETGNDLLAAGLARLDTGAIPIPRPRPSIPERIREHPYVRLALNGTFSALWVGQLISLFGDRVNQIALGAFVYEVTDSPLALALTFLVGTIPNLLFSPFAGVYVDRWEQKQLMVVSDILRAAFVLLIPVAVLINVWLAYPLVFAVTTVSIFFRPARQAVLPRIVPDDDLLVANSAMWVGETLADIPSYALAGLFVVFLASSLPLAFWFDAATYLASAALLTTMIVPPVIRAAQAGTVRTSAADDARSTGSNAETMAVGGGAARAARDDEAIDEPPATASSVLVDLREGWAFLRHETVLLANTLQGAAGQFAIGFLTVASLVLAAGITPGHGDEYRGTYAFMEASIGLGNLVGGFALGLLAGRARKGLMVALGYAAFGVMLVLIGVAQSIPFVLALLFGVGVANMAFVIPSQTLFQERTPAELMGRVVSFRFALVFGGMSLAMGIGGVLMDPLGAGPVIAIGGVLSVAAGLASLFVRAVREA